MIDCLSDVADCRNFVNADLIAAGVSPLSPDREWLAAGRLFLREIDRYIQAREDFAFETTLSGRSYLRLIRQLLTDGCRHSSARGFGPAFETTLSGRSYLRLIRQLLTDGWRVELYYLWLPSVEMSVERVAERVAHGGHDIPRESINRRYPRSIANLLKHYAPLCSSTICVDNSTTVPEVIFIQNAEGRRVENPELFEILWRGAGHD